jgi:hypothetical protein
MIGTLFCTIQASSVKLNKANKVHQAFVIRLDFQQSASSLHGSHAQQWKGKPEVAGAYHKPFSHMFQIKPTKDPNTCRAHVSIYARKLGMQRIKVTEDIANISVCWVQMQACGCGGEQELGILRKGMAVFFHGLSLCV